MKSKLHLSKTDPTTVGSLIKKSALLSGVIVVFAGIVAGGVANALSVPPNSSTTSNTSSTTKQAQQQKLQNIISKGTQEIDRRLTNLNTVLPKISESTKLSSSDQTQLENEVKSDISGLTTLKTQLSSATTLSSAVTDVQSIFTEYRVYALELPKIYLIKTADDQQVTEGKLNSLAQKLQTRLTDLQNSGKSVATLQSDLTDMQSKVSAAQKISSGIESSVIGLQPSDYNSNHEVLSGDATQLKTALADEQAAYTDAKNIVSGLESLKS